MFSPTYAQFLIGSVAGACCGAWVRALGGLALNGFVDWAHVKYFLLGSLVVPELSLYALVAFVVVGSPVFFWARQRNRLSPWLFAGLAAAVGFLASYPISLVPSWAFLYAFSGFVGGSICFATTRALTSRSSGPSASSAVRRPLS